MGLSGVSRGLKSRSRLAAPIRTPAALHTGPYVHYGQRRASAAQATAISTAFSIEAAETMIQLCNIDEWPESRRLPSTAAAACSVIFPAVVSRPQQSSSTATAAPGSTKPGTAIPFGPDDQVLSQLLVAVLGDLEATLANPQLSKLLYQLPPSSIKLLLSSGNITTPSEDTVWFIVQQYIDTHLAQKAARHQRQIWDLEPACVAALYEDLYSLIRVPHVTDFCLSSIDATVTRVAVASGREDYDVLVQHVGEFKDCRELDGFVPEYKLREMVQAGAPRAWLLPARNGV